MCKPHQKARRPKKTTSMETIYWKDALKIVDQLTNKEVDFNNESIHWQVAMRFGHVGIDVPSKLIDNEEENIVYDTDNPERTTEELENAKQLHSIEVLLNNENYEWLTKEVDDPIAFFNNLIEKQKRLPPA